MGCNTSQEKTAIPAENGDIIVNGDNVQNVDVELINKMKSDVTATTTTSANNGMSDSAIVNGNDDDDDLMGKDVGT